MDQSKHDAAIEAYHLAALVAVDDAARRVERSDQPQRVKDNWPGMRAVIDSSVSRVGYLLTLFGAGLPQDTLATMVARDIDQINTVILDVMGLSSVTIARMSLVAAMLSAALEGYGSALESEGFRTKEFMDAIRNTPVLP